MSPKGLLPWSIAAFAITNIDDLFLLTLFFAGKTRGEAIRVAIGQYLGFSVILAASIALGFAGSLVAGRWVALLGVVPLFLGVRDGVRLWRNRTSPSALPSSRPTKALFEVASITIANGVDNLAVYSPVFAVLGWRRASVVSTVFYIMVGTWCLAGWMLVRHQRLVQVLDRIGHILLPGALIVVGLVILRGVL